MIMNIVGPIIINPLALAKNAIPGLSKGERDIARPKTNRGIAHLRNPVSFLVNGNDRIKRPSGRTKKSVPPQEANANPRNIPPPTSLAAPILCDADFSPLKNR